MTATFLGFCLIGLLFLLLFLRVSIWIGLLVTGVLGNIILNSLGVALSVTGANTFDSASNYGLSVVPLFILMGDVASGSRLSSELFQAARVILSGVRGGLAIAAIGASGAFGAVCGSSIATAATMTRIAIPEMRKANYEDGFAASSVAAGGSLGILIPPSIILVIYGAIAEQSVQNLFAAAFIPGIVLLVLYILIAIWIANRNPEKAPADPAASFLDRLKALREPWQFIVLFIVTIGGIYAGIFSPNEAAAIGAFGAIVLGFLGRRLTMAQLVRCFRTSVITSCALFMIVIAANLFSNFVVQTQLPDVLLSAAHAAGFAPWGIMVTIIAVYILLGCFLEGIGMVLITVPVFLPVVTGYGYNPVWFAIIVVIVVELGLIHPPVGMNLFVIQAQLPDVRIGQMYRGILPFLVAPFALILLLFLFPQLALWLPSVLY
ncbi:TRAP transporter large permease [Roseibium litorale]|uniref:TRAP transporter large permease protein n=1 Tax=Roseibium litorale TaxID=2803841 RepID=A0ABR9CRC9_9HYPH|nr:TRAP transporter large permease [Roseibium litorale]MBD8893389.1 TRAP transporter large permease [Roseibium litorale]